MSYNKKKYIKTLSANRNWDGIIAVLMYNLHGKFTLYMYV